MLDTLRKPPFIIALVLIALTLLVEVGAVGWPTPGYGIPYVALLDGLLLFTVGLMGIALVVPERVHGRVQGIATLVVSLLSCSSAPSSSSWWQWAC